MKGMIIDEGHDYIKSMIIDGAWLLMEHDYWWSMIIDGAWL